jgi:hypothetical protein
MSFYITYIMLINVTSINQTIYIFVSVGEASVIVGDRGVAIPKRVCEGGGGIVRSAVDKLVQKV